MLDIVKTIENLVYDNFYADLTTYVSKVNDYGKLTFIMHETFDNYYLKEVFDALDDKGIAITLAILSTYENEQYQEIIRYGDELQTHDFILISKSKQLLLKVPQDISEEFGEFEAYGVLVERTKEDLKLTFGLIRDEFIAFDDSEINEVSSNKNPVNQHALKLMGDELIYD